MASACALAIFSGIVILISRLSRSAERSKRYFHRGIVMIKRRFQTANAGRLCDPSREIRIIIMLPLLMRKANAERIFDRYAAGYLTLLQTKPAVQGSARRVWL